MAQASKLLGFPHEPLFFATVVGSDGLLDFTTGVMETVWATFKRGQMEFVGRRLDDGRSQVIVRKTGDGRTTGVPVG